MVGYVRLRVVFEDAALLSRSQRRQSLQRCWFQLRPDLMTIANLAARLHQTFGLHRSCPHGLIISMDDFVLPPFESTHILKDEDTIMINKNGVFFKDDVKFCGSQNQEQVLQSRESLVFNNRSLTRMDPQGNSEGDEQDVAACNGSAVHMDIPSSEKVNARCKRKHSNNIQGSDHTFAIKDSHGDSRGNMAHEETPLNEMVNKKCKKKHTHKIQTSVTLESKDLLADTQRDKDHLHKETPSEMIRVKQKKKHFDKLQGSNDILAIEKSYGNPQRDEQEIGHHVNTMHKEAISHGMVKSKRKRKHYNKLQASVRTLTSKNSKVYSQDEADLGLPDGSNSHQEIPSCEWINAKRKRKRSGRHQSPHDILAIKDSFGDADGNEEDAGAHGSIVHNVSTVNEMMNVNYKKSHSNKHHISNTLAIVNSQEDGPGDDEDVDFPSGKVVPTVTTREMTNVFKRRRYNKLKASKTLTSKNSKVYSQVEAESGLPDGSKSLQEIPACELINAKRKRKCLINANDILAIKDSLGDLEGNEEDAGAHGSILHNASTVNEMMNRNHKKSHSNKHHTSNTLAIVNSQEDVPGDDEDGDFPSGKVVPTVTTTEITNVLERSLSTGNDDGYDVNRDTKKGQSRSAARKKAKRRWHRTHDSKNNSIEIQVAECGNLEEQYEHANAVQNTNLDKDIFPVMVHPGHIRFETSDESSVREDELVETLQWNGTTNKKKGQKWGREKSCNKLNDDISNQLCNGESEDKEAEEVEVSNGKSAVEEVETSKDSIAKQVDPVTECGSSIGKELIAVKQLIDYESFPLLTRLPTEDDILIYRVVELSSSWCPELSPFRVGKVSSYNSSSSKIILFPLREYPVVSEEMIEEGRETCSLYNEDGTLEIDFPFLLDVRLFKASESEAPTPSSPIEEMQNAAPVNNLGSKGCFNHTVNGQQLSEDWEEINRVIDQKKAQLERLKKVDKMDPGTSTSPWSYKAVRRNALGPTLAMLRSGGQLM